MDCFVSQWNTDPTNMLGMHMITMGMNPHVVFR